MRTPSKRLWLLVGLLASFAACGGSAGDGPTTTDPGGGTKIQPGTGKTDFSSDEPSSGGFAARNPGAAEGAAPAPSAGGATTAGKSADNAAPMAPGAPGGRVADVEEADIYKIDGTRLFYFNTYRGFLIYDVADPSKPQRLARLPVFGYPVEMFVSGNTVYALLRDALYLGQKNGQLQFERHNVSQLVAIDVSDVKNPKVLKTIDIVGQLREGVSRKIENTIYVVSYLPSWYWWGWQVPTAAERKAQAWVYSFDVSDPKEPKKAGELQIFEGGTVNFYDQKTGASYNRNFSDIAISATSNALMVVENWYVYASSGGRNGGCGSYESNQQAIVSIIDVSDPKGKIRRHTRFETSGSLTDQFKMTYAFDDKSKKGTYYGIFARQTWSAANCTGQTTTLNTLESWDVSNGDAPERVGRLDFGKPNETVRASTFDLDRQVVYAITARRVDPLYAISIADPRAPKVLSAIDGLSGEMSVFRLVADKKFILAVGQDSSDACTGFQDTSTWRSANIAVSLIDVRDLQKIRLVQRQCVAVKNAEWIGSSVTWNLDQAHKMIGMYSDDQTNVVTVPVYYYKKSENAGDWWWYRHETAVGIMAWDLSKYDDKKSEKDQTVLQNFGTFIHPNGEVQRTIVFNHAALKRRMMINLSDTHITVADLQDLANPTLKSTIELAPYYNEIYRFGDYLVEQVQSVETNGNPNQDQAEFRVKKAGGDLDDVAPVATFSLGGVQRVIRQGNQLVLFRTVQQEQSKTNPGVYVPPKTDALVYDLTDPTKPKQGGTVTLPQAVMPYYRFYCGVGWWGGYWFDSGGSNWASTDDALIFLTQEWKYDGKTNTATTKIVTLDLRDPMMPKTSETVVDTNTTDWGSRSLVADPSNSKGFYVTFRNRVGESKVGDTTIAKIKNFVQRWEREGDKWVGKESINLPGRLVKTWVAGDGTRLFLSQDQIYEQVKSGTNTTWNSYLRLALLRQVTANDRAAAELLDSHEFKNLQLAAMALDGEKLYLNGRPGNYYGYGYGGGGIAVPGVAVKGLSAAAEAVREDNSDRLMIFDLAGGRLRSVYDQPTSAYNVELMGAHGNKLFVNLSGDGILVVDVSNPAKPTGSKFMRTLGYATHLEFFGNEAYVASGYFGLSRLDLTAASDLPLE